MMFCNYAYGFRFLVESNAITLVTRLKFLPNDLPGALGTCMIPWIQLFDFKVKLSSRRFNVVPDSLSCRLRGEGESEPDDDDDLREIMDASLRRTNVEQVSNSKMREGQYKTFVWSRLAEEYMERWKDRG